VERVDLEEQPVLEIDDRPEDLDENINLSLPQADRFWPSPRTRPVPREMAPLGYRSRLADMRPLNLGMFPQVVYVLALRWT
jgi:hypothetical protein